MHRRGLPPSHPVTTMKFLIAAATASAVGLAGLYSVGNASLQKALTDCNKGNTAICYGVASHLQNKITNIQYHDRLQAAKLARQAEEKKAEEAREAAEAKRIAAANAAEAKFKAEGWWEVSDGVYMRWCTDTNPCPGSANDHYTDYVWRAMVWCKEQACGDIYARINITNNGTVMGWTNETAYGDYGQKVVLTFGSHVHGSAELTEFIARG